MSDPRLTLVRGGIASVALEGLVRADRYVAPTAMRCARPAAAIRKTPDPVAGTEDQLIFGEAFDVLLTEGDFAFGQARRDGYVGFVETAAFVPGAGEPTHWISALRTYAFSRPDLKSPPTGLYTQNSFVAAGAREGRFVEVEGAGWMVEAHLTPIGVYLDDPAEIAAAYLSAPYQWGGRESAGLDCSGLVQQALYAAGRTGPRDTDMQGARVGRPVGRPDLERGDLVFWPGHVAMMIDETHILHANAHHMAVRIEPLDEAIARIEAAGVGKPSGYRRP
jgi:hypothetical protein